MGGVKALGDWHVASWVGAPPSPSSSPGKPQEKKNFVGKFSLMEPLSGGALNGRHGPGV
jgi:hypothetical protein